MTSDELQEDKPTKKGFSAIKFALIAFSLAILIPVGFQFVLKPALLQRQGEQTLAKVKESYGPVRGFNNELVTFKGQTIKKANIQQKALGRDKVATAPAAFIFDNGKPTEGKKIVDVYVDFNTQKSRDFLILNKNNFQTLLESGKITLKIHALPNGNAFNMYAAEGLAEAFYTSPEQAWDYLYALLKNGVTLKTDKPDDIVKVVVEAARASRVKDVDDKSIVNGTFASWILSGGDDERIQKNFSTPMIYSNGREINPNDLNINNPDDMRKAILK